MWQHGSELGFDGDNSEKNKGFRSRHPSESLPTLNKSMEKFLINFTNQHAKAWTAKAFSNFNIISLRQKKKKSRHIYRSYR